MNAKSITMLLIEDNPGDVRLIRELLAEHQRGDRSGSAFGLVHADRLSTGLQHLKGEPIDVLLLDLGLPDGRGLDTFTRVHNEASGVPVVVLTDLDDEDMAIQAVQKGAQDYLVKGRMDGELLVRAVRYAVERHRLLVELEESRQREQQEREFTDLARLAGSDGASAADRAPSRGPLAETVPDGFNELVRRYRDAMDLALEKRVYRVDHPVSKALRRMGEQLGHLGAGPRDVVDLHTMALKQKTAGASHEKAQACMVEGRLMALELMGYLASFYRNALADPRTGRPAVAAAEAGRQGRGEKGHG